MENKNLKVELFRIIAILLVILQHSLPAFLSKVNNTYLALDTLSSMSVCIFFVMSGFFLYNDKPWIKKFRNYLFNIFIPMLIVAILALIFEDFIMKQKSFVDCILTNDYIKIIKKFVRGLINWSCIPWGFVLGHMWYVFSYGFIILFYPIANYMINKLDKKILYIISICYFLYMAIILNILKLAENRYHIFDVMFISIYGYILYNDIFKFLKNKIKNLKNKIILISILLTIWCILFYIICHYQKQIYTISSARIFITYNSALMILLVIITLSILYLLLINVDIDKKILIFSEKTFLIYLLHDDIIVLAMQYGIYNLFAKNMTNSITAVFYTILFVISIYIFTWIISVLITKIALAKK